MKPFTRPRLSSLIPIILLLLISFANAQDSDDTNTKCTRPSAHADPCAFVRAYCGDEAGLINYLELRYCRISSQNVGWFFVLAVFLTIAYFYALFRVSDVHLTTALQSISDHLRLSSEVAGLTLLSFGNGAPDLFTAFAGVSSGDFDLIFGATVGSGMFILNVVLGSIIIASYYRHKNTMITLPQNTHTETQHVEPLGAELERRPSVSNPESFVRLRRRLQSITRALRLKAPKQYSFPNLVVEFRGIAIDKFSHLRNMTIYTIAVIILIVIFDDGTVHWFEPVILLLYYIFFLAFFIGRHFYLKRALRKKREGNTRSQQLALEPISNNHGNSFESVPSNLDAQNGTPRTNSTTLSGVKPASSPTTDEYSNVLGLTIPKLVVTDADNANPQITDESGAFAGTNHHQRNYLLRANKPDPINTTRFGEPASTQDRAVPTVVVSEENCDSTDTNDKNSEFYVEKEETQQRNTSYNIFSLMKLHFYEDSDIVNAIKDRCRVTKPTSAIQWIKVGVEAFCTLFWIFMIPIRCLICLSMPPFLSDMISEVDDDIREEDEDNLEEIAMNTQIPEEYAEDILNSNMIRYACGCHIVEHEKQSVTLGSESTKNSEEHIHLPSRQNKLLTVPSSDSNVVVPSTSNTYTRCMGRKDSIRCVRPSASQRSFMSGGVQSSNASDASNIQPSPELVNSIFMTNSTSNSAIRSLDNGAMSENIRKAPWWWPLPRKAMIRFIYHLTHVPVHRFLKYRILSTIYPITAILLVIYLTGFNPQATGRLALLIIAALLIILGCVVTYPISTIATDFGSGFAGYLDAKSLLSPRLNSSPTPSSATLYSPSLNTSSNGEPISLSTDERNIARYLKFLLMAYCKGVYSESNPCHVPLRSIKIATVLYLYELLCAFITFAMSILWIYVVSNEIVALLASLGTILSLSKAIIGLTVLAWGNSLGDFFADVSMARAGFFRVAFTAVWAGPIQNLLLTLGITLLIGCFQSRPAGASLSMATISLPPISPTIWLGFGFLLFSVVILSGVLLAFYYKFRLPLSLGIMLIFNFVAYLISSIILEWRMETH
ncbi:Mitochondrial sodium/calcium exchanger protein [Basidiobolus ranarum]|uniref:Mitochondrial sodium/calcium exchanger protein n=1 Tax=Basidiobolus ranarum TaxID=34480 RepID=A0ABR2W1S1_9FUNG